jgi:hypothetical protein
MSDKMHFFESFTQFDHRYDELYPKESKYKKSACSFFSLISAYNFLNSKITMSKKSHQDNIDQATLNYICKEIKGHLSFEELLKYSTVDIKTIEATSVELINENIIGFEHMFPENYQENYVIIFLKMSKFFIVAKSGNMYHVRDCHEQIQYDFTSRSDMLEHLIKIYSFTNIINAGGIDLPEFSNIEFITIKNKFDITLEKGIVYPFPKIDAESDEVEKDSSLSEEQMAIVENNIEQYKAVVECTKDETKYNKSDYIDVDYEDMIEREYAEYHNNQVNYDGYDSFS